MPITVPGAHAIASGGVNNYVMTAVDANSVQGEANLQFDGTDLTIASGSIEVRTIDYSDGDLAMTIADGGGVTFAQATTFSGGITNSGTIAAGTWQGGTVAVGYGGTGATSLVSNRVLTGNGTSAITAESNLTFDGTTLTVATGKTLFTNGQIGIATAVPDDNYAIYMNYDFENTSNVVQGFSMNVTGHKVAGGAVADWYLRGLDVDMRIGNLNRRVWTATVGIRALEIGTTIHADAEETVTGVAGLYIQDAVSGGMTITNNYGIYMDTQSGGSNNVGINMGSNTIENIGASGNDIYSTGSSNLALKTGGTQIELQGIVEIGDGTVGDGNQTDHYIQGGNTQRVAQSALTLPDFTHINGGLVMVTGQQNSGAANKFIDLVLCGESAGNTPTVVSAHTVAGTPPARTYAMASAGVLTLVTDGSSGWDCNVLTIASGPPN